MKKFLPIILFLLGIVVLAGVYFFVIRHKNEESFTEIEELAIEIPISLRPFVSLIPTEDGHYLKLTVENIEIEAASMDYELLYQTSSGITQGIPGIIKLEGKKSFQTELLLGSESSGKFRYDEGVEEGTLTLRFRNDKGKLVGKFVTDFHLQEDSNLLSSVDGKFKYNLKEAYKGFALVMETFGLPGGDLPAFLASGPYGVFSSKINQIPGKIDLNDGDVFVWERGKWTRLEAGEYSGPGVFVLASKVAE